MEFVTVLCAIGVTLLFMEVVSLERDIENLENQLNQLVGYVNNLLEKSEKKRRGIIPRLLHYIKF